MTTIWCELHDCMYIRKGKTSEHLNSCRATAIGINEDGKCDTYLTLPDPIKKRVDEEYEKRAAQTRRKTPESGE